MARPGALVIGGVEIRPGERKSLELTLPPLFTHTPLNMPIHVVRGRQDGPRLFVSAAIHGDELNGVEAIRRIIRRPGLDRLRGTLVAVPMVNVYGVLQNSRYLPDRRDLNRSFPGSRRGSLTGRLAELFMRDVVAKCTHGIDLHTGAVHRDNLPQVRARLDDPETLALARAFAVPVLLDAAVRDGSLRAAAVARGIPILLYEGGEALRFQEEAIGPAVRGVVNVMRHLGMLPASKRRPREPYVARSSRWLRAVESGVFCSLVRLGQRVRSGEVLGTIADPLGTSERSIRAGHGGIVIGRSNLPLVHQGEALFHIARFADAAEVESEVEAFHDAVAGGGDAAAGTGRLG